MVIKRKQLYQRDAKAPHVCSYVIVRFGGIWRVYSLRLQEYKNRQHHWLCIMYKLGFVCEILVMFRV